jgi:predicted nucleic acid-binding protein
VTDYVFDSFALVAYLQGEPGAARVNEIVEAAGAGEGSLSMTTVNVGESVYIAYRRQGSRGVVRVLDLLASLPIEIVDADLQLSVTAARIKAVTPIAYGDCFAAALALERGATLLTGDPEFEQLGGLVEVEWLPRP